MASNAPVSGSVVKTAEKAENSELAQKLPALLSGEVQNCLAEMFRLAISTPLGVADIQCEWSGGIFQVSAWLPGEKGSPSFYVMADVCVRSAHAEAAHALGAVSAFVAGAWILAGGKGGAS